MPYTLCISTIFHEEEICSLYSTNMCRGGVVRRVVGKHLVSPEKPTEKQKLLPTTVRQSHREWGAGRRKPIRTSSLRPSEHIFTPRGLGVEEKYWCLWCRNDSSKKKGGNLLTQRKGELSPTKANCGQKGRVHDLEVITTVHNEGCHRS